LNALMSNMTDVEMSEVIHRLQTAEMYPEERGLKQFTYLLLMKLSNYRPPSDGSFDAQLDAHHASQAPDHQHRMALKNFCRYLRRTKDWGLIYRREHPLESLPHVPLDQPVLDESLPPFLTQSALARIGFVNAAHAIDGKTRRSVTGWVFTFASGRAVAYKSMLRTTVATSSVVHAAKTANSLRSVLSDLGFPQDGPTDATV
jgi:hypothetical protein